MSPQSKHNIPVPVAFRVLIKRCKHDRQNGLDIVADEVTEVLVIPEVQCTFCHLEAVSYLFSWDDMVILESGD